MHISPRVDPFRLHDLVIAARRLDPTINVFGKHRNKEYEWVLCLPASDLGQYSDFHLSSGPQDKSGNDQQRYFGCNLLDWSKSVEAGHRLPGDPDDKYVLLATPIDLRQDRTPATVNVEFTSHQFQIIQEHTQNINMAASPRMARSPVAAPESASGPSPLSALSTPWSTEARASVEEDNDMLTFDSNQEIKSPLSTIEDSFEELDRAEDEQAELDRFKDNIDAITVAASQMSLTSSRGLSPQQQAAGPTTRNGETSGWAQRADTSHDSEQSTSTSSPVHFSEETAPYTGSPQRGQATQSTTRDPPTATLRRVARPASLAPPKPIRKAKKQPTTSTFELPGERVARELKERKAARLSMQVDPQKATEVTNSPQRTRSVRSSKPPTVPNFELPGERLSRQKKERFEQKLKEAEEQAQQRRQFKARPSPASAAPTVRSTFTSRQRQTPAQPDQVSVLSPNSDFSPRSGVSKRQSVTMTPSTARTVSISSATTASTGRGRRSSVGSAKASTRATSSSTGSAMSGAKRNSVAAETPKQQKSQGRQIHNRATLLGRTQEQEKRDREESMRLARQKYAQMSRNLAATSRARRSQQQSSSSA